MKIILSAALLLCFFIGSNAKADTLTELEIKCWNQATDDDGSFLCQYVLAMGKDERQTFVVPSVAAPDEGGPKTEEQADRACRAMGFRYAKRFELVKLEKEETLVRIDATLREGDLRRGVGSILQHIACRD